MKRIRIIAVLATFYLAFSCGVIHTNQESKAKTTQKSTTPGNSKVQHPHGAPPGQTKKNKKHPHGAPPGQKKKGNNTPSRG